MPVRIRTLIFKLESNLYAVEKPYFEKFLLAIARPIFHQFDLI